MSASWLLAGQLTVTSVEKPSAMRKARCGRGERGQGVRSPSRPLGSLKCWEEARACSRGGSRAPPERASQQEAFPNPHTVPPGPSAKARAAARQSGSVVGTNRRRRGRESLKPKRVKRSHL